jgi:hypothetical protein
VTFDFFLRFGFVLFRFFVRLNMASDIQDGGRSSKIHKFEILQHFCILQFAMSLFLPGT